MAHPSPGHRAAHDSFGWPMFRHVERQACRMNEMMDCLKVDTLALARAQQGNAYAAARSRCPTCGTTDRCIRWLDKPAGLRGRPDFCPNLRLFESYPRRAE